MSNLKEKLNALKQVREKRFWKKVKKSTGCWEWVGAKNRDGYGLSWWDSKFRLSHRVSYALNTDDFSFWDDKKIFVCHHCDNPSCIRPDHLFLGTAGDNTRDCVKKGRHYLQKNPEQGKRVRDLGFGKSSCRARLSPNDVREIRLKLKLKITHEKIAAEYGVTDAAISNIKMGRFYTWVK